jgi:uncharacterized glyoxalase superfamily protein PhnB
MMEIRRLIPVLVYEDIENAYRFLIDVIGFETGELHRDDTGRVVHGEVRSGPNVIWLHRVVADFKLASPRALESASSGMSLQVSDVDAHYKNAQRRGAAVEKEPADMPYGLREYGLRDAEGHRWWISSPLA